MTTTSAAHPDVPAPAWRRLAGLAFLALTLGATAGPAAAAPKSCSGRYLMPEGIGGARGEKAALEIDGAVVRLAGCRIVSPVRRTLGKRAALRAALDCGEAKTRVRLVPTADCTSIGGEVLLKGRLLRRFVASLSRCGDGEVDTDAGETCEPSLHVGCDEATCTATGGLPEGAIAIAAADNAPRMTGFAPTHAEAGDEITISGQNFNRRRSGTIWTGTPPYRLYFPKDGPPFVVQAEFTFVSPTELRAVVPANAATGRLMFAEAVQGGVGSFYNQSATDFVVDVPPPPPGAPTVLRVVNDTQYNLVDLRLNDVQAITQQQNVAPGTAFEVPFTTPGTVQIVAGIGFFDAFGTPDVWFQIGGSATVSTGETTVFTLRAITVANLLSNFGQFADWQGEYYDANGVPHLARYRFFADGTWQLFDDGVQIGTGIAFVTSWPNFASEVGFRVSPGPNAVIGFPFGSFLMNNGPPSWPTIQYVRQ